MGWFGKIFGSDKTIEKTLDAAYSGLDKVWHTEEEKADHFKSLLKLYEPFKLAQRLLALIVTCSYCGIWVVCALLFSVSAFFDPCLDICKANQLMSISQELASFNNQILGTPTAIILAFYFGGGAVEGFVKAKGLTR